MSKRLFRVEDSFRLKAALDPHLAADGRRIAFSLSEVDQEKDRPLSSIWVAPTDGSAAPRRFTEGPADHSPRFSPDGRCLAYISVTDDRPEDAHIRLAPLDGGVPYRLGDLPGSVTQLAWSPDSARLVVVCRTGGPAADQLSPAERNAPRLMRGLAARRDPAGWQEGRRHLFLIELEDGSARQLTRGEFDHDDPSFSPDGASIVCAADRQPRRDDLQFRSDAWIVPVAGGRARRLTEGTGAVSSPLFSPDGAKVAFFGQISDAWDADPHVFVVPADGTGSVEPVAPETDRPTATWPGVGSALAWIGPGELAMLVADRGSNTLHRARLGDKRSRVLIGGDIEIAALAVQPGRRTLAFTAGWVDRPSEVFTTTLSGATPVRISHFNDELASEVELAPVKRATIRRPDGTEVEYFTLLAPNRAGKRLPLLLDIHGGPHGAWPSAAWLGFHQAIAAAGYCVLLPNPRGSIGYGQAFTSGCTGDWGGGDYEDILACCDDLIERGVADPRRQFVTGGSYGGFMTGWIVGHTDRFRAASAVAAVIDQRSMALTTDIPEFSRFSMGGTPWERPDEYELRSPLRYLPQVSTPVLVIHWEGDIRVPIGQGEELYTGLRLLGKPAEMLRYPGGFHSVRTPSQAVDWARQILEWNRRHDTGNRGRVAGRGAKA